MSGPGQTADDGRRIRRTKKEGKRGWEDGLTGSMTVSFHQKQVKLNVRLEKRSKAKACWLEVSGWKSSTNFDRDHHMNLSIRVAHEK